MEYYIKHEGINEDETLIECELQIGDFCSIETIEGDVEITDETTITYISCYKQVWVINNKT